MSKKNEGEGLEPKPKPAPQEDDILTRAGDAKPGKPFRVKGLRAAEQVQREGYELTAIIGRSDEKLFVFSGKQTKEGDQ